MVYIHSFRIEGLAGSSRAVEQTLDRHVNVYWGLNGSGKTSLLKILHSALQNEVDVLERVPFETAEVVFSDEDNGTILKRTISRKDLLKGADRRSYSVEVRRMLEIQSAGIEIDPTYWARAGDVTWETVVLAGGLKEQEQRGRRRRAAKPPTLNLGYDHLYLPISRLTHVGRGTARERPSAIVDDAYLDEQFASQVRFRWQEYNSQALSRVRAIQQRGLAEVLSILFGAGGGGAGVSGSEHSVVDSSQEEFSVVSAFLREQRIPVTFSQPQFVQRYESNQDLRHVVSRIREVMRHVDDALRPQHDFQRVIEGLYAGDKKLVFESSAGTRASLGIEVGGKRVPLQSLSSGEKQLLRLMLEVLSAGSSTVMIDEPELSMHVDWQVILVDAMRRVNPECQLLLATHSPEVMAEVPEQFVFQL